MYRWQLWGLFLIVWYFFRILQLYNTFRCTFFVPLHSVLCDVHWLNVAPWCAWTLLAQGAVRGSWTHEVLCNCPPPRKINLLFFIWFIIERHEGHKQLFIEHHLFQQTKQTLATNWHFHTLQFHNSITVGSLSVAFAGGSVPGEVCSAPSACTAMPSGALFRGNGDMAHGLEVMYWEFTN